MAVKPKYPCQLHDPEIWHPVGRGPAPAAQEVLAKRYCATCPIKVVCLETALAGGEHGIWGGTTEDERREIARRRGVRSEETEEIRAAMRSALASA